MKKGTVVQPIAGSAVTPVQAPDKSTVAAASGEIEFGYCSEFLIEKIATPLSKIRCGCGRT